MALCGCEGGLPDTPVFELGNAKVTDLCAPTSTQEHIGRL